MVLACPEQKILPQSQKEQEPSDGHQGPAPGKYANRSKSLQEKHEQPNAEEDRAQGDVDPGSSGYATLEQSYRPEAIVS